MDSVLTHSYYHPLYHHRDLQLLDGWVLAALSSQLPTAGTSWVADLSTQTVLLVRGDDGVVRAFENSCLHRGTQIQPVKTGRHSWKGDAIDQIQCGYHGWRYTLNGRLQHVPSPKGIQCKQDQMNEYAVYERAGFIWVSTSKPRLAPDGLFEPIVQAVEHYRLDEMEPIEARDFRFSVNWKIALENALDYYHVTTVHPKTVGAHVETEPTFKDLGWHSLQTLHIAPYGWRGLLDRHCARHRQYSDHELSSLHKYFVFPNVIINVLPYHLTVMQVFPTGPTECVMRYRFCQRRSPGMLERTRVWASWVASRVILYEDVRIYDQIQQGMMESSLARQPLHQHERGVGHFHGTLERWFTEVDQWDPALEASGMGVSFNNRRASDG